MTCVCVKRSYMYAVGSDLDARTRAKLWQNGWDFNHGTGHGIGYFLNVHEGPGRIAISFLNRSPLYDGMFFSDGRCCSLYNVRSSLCWNKFFQMAHAFVHFNELL